MAEPREVLESPVTQGEDESKKYAFYWGWIGIPTSQVVVIKDINLDATLTDRSAVCLSGNPTVVGAYVITPLVTSILPGHEYRLECKVTISGSIFERFCRIIGEA